MTNNFLAVTAIALATMAISLTTSRALVFAPFRMWVASKSSWLGELVSCFYCTSHWVAIALVVIYRPVLVQKWLPLDFFVSVFVVVAISAVLNALVTRLTPMQRKMDSSSERELQALRSALEVARNLISSQQEQIKQFHK